MLEVLTAATATDLIELATVKAHLRPAITGTGEDARLGDLIRWASAAINRHCRRTFARQKYLQTLAGSGSQTLMLARGPVEVDSNRRILVLSLNGTGDVTDYRVEDAVAGFLWRANGWPSSGAYVGRYGRRWSRVSQDLETITAEYWAGYQMPGETPVTGAYELPADVERAALLTVQHWHRGMGRDPGLQSSSTTETRVDGTSATSSWSYAAPQTLGDIGPLPGEAKALLEGFRR